MAGTPAFAVMETGDIILAVDGKLVTRFRVRASGSEEIPKNSKAFLPGGVLRI